MDRQPPRSTSDEVDLYIRTYYSLLRSTGEVRVRAFEEAHGYSRSSLHEGARSPDPDVAAFAYGAARLPDCFARIQRVVMGQSFEQFEAAGMAARTWVEVKARGRRRAMRWDGAGTLAVFITSASDIDDLVPIVTAYQIEWNKLHARLVQAGPGGAGLGLPTAEHERLLAALGRGHGEALARIAAAPCDLAIRLLNGSLSQYQTTAHRWWSGIEPRYLAGGLRRPLYFVSSNTHSLINLLGGYARAHRGQIVDFARREDPEGLRQSLEDALARDGEDEVADLSYYLLRAFLKHGDPARLAEVQAWDAAGGMWTIDSPGHIDVGAQLIELGSLDPARFDPRVAIPGVDRLRHSSAVILNIDYPLGMAAYHHLSRVAQGAGELRGVYVMGKAATLNGRVGDVMVSKAVHDEHSRNTYLFRNCFAAADVQPFMRDGTVLDNQKAVTVRSAFLQNRDYMSGFYDEGYTVLEMEAGPYLSAVYEIISPTRYPDDEIVNLSSGVPFDLGILHYASDTPYSRRQSLLSKSLSFFGVESTYAAAIAIVRRIFTNEIANLPK